MRGHTQIKRFRSSGKRDRFEENWIIAFCKLSGMQPTRRTAAHYSRCNSTKEWALANTVQNHSSNIQLNQSINQSIQQCYCRLILHAYGWRQVKIRVVWLEEIGSTANHWQALVYEETEELKASRQRELLRFSKKLPNPFYSVSESFVSIQRTIHH